MKHIKTSIHFRYKSYKEKLKHDVIESQKKLLTQIRNLPPGIEPKQEKRKLSIDYTPHRTKRRYFQILSQIRAKVDDHGCSSDENYPEGPPPSLSRKQKRHLNSIKSGLGKEKVFVSTMSLKIGSNSIADLERYITPTHNPFYLNDESYKNLIYCHKRKKLNCPDDPELNTKGITISDIVHRTQLPYIKSIPSHPVKHHHHDNKVSSHKRRIKKESPEILFSRRNHHAFMSSESDSDSTIDVQTPKPKIKTHKPKPPPVTPPKVKVEVKKELPPPPVVEPPKPPVNTTPPITPISSLSQYGKITPVKVEDLEGIDMMNIPIDLDNSDIDILSEFTCKPELMQDTHSNFFSLIRDVICSTTEHRMNMYTLQERLKAWQENPISPLNDWYNLTDNWLSLLPSAITFLCGNSSEQPDDFVPYMEYKIQVDMYQWIGAGRDSDGLLTSLCQFWLEHRSETKAMSPFSKEKDDLDVDVDRTGSPPPPRYTTNWTVRKATLDEIKDFQEQERKRYDNPHKAFTFRLVYFIYRRFQLNLKAKFFDFVSLDFFIFL